MKTEKIKEEIIKDIKKQCEEDIKNELELYHIQQIVHKVLFDGLLDVIEAVSDYSSDKAIKETQKQTIEEVKKMIDCRRFNEDIDEIAKKRGFRTEVIDGKVWTLCNNIKGYLLSKLDIKEDDAK